MTINYQQRIQLNNQQMLRQSGTITNSVIQRLDHQLWSSIAEKAIDKMPKYKLAIQSQRMFHDFAIMNGNIKQSSGTFINQEKDNVINPQESLIVGTSKLIPNTRRLNTYSAQSMPKSVTARKYNHKPESYNQIQQKQPKIHPKKNNNFFKLSFTEVQNTEEQKLNDILRTTKYQNIRYNKSLEQNELRRKVDSEHRSLAEQKRFKDMKTYTYDYEGKVMSLGTKNTQNIKVIKMKSHFSNFMKTFRSINRKQDQSPQLQQVDNKRVIAKEKTNAELIKEKERITEEQQKERIAKYLKNIKVKNMFQSFQVLNSVQVGVNIVDQGSKTKYKGLDRDKSDIKNLKLTEYTGRRKPIQSFKQKLAIKKQKNLEQKIIRTQYLQQEDRLRVNTQYTDKTRIFTASTRVPKSRGKIDVKNQKLYSQNFVQDMQ